MRRKNIDSMGQGAGGRGQGAGGRGQGAGAVTPSIDPSEFRFPPRVRERLLRDPTMRVLLPRFDEIQRRPKKLADLVACAHVEVRTLRRTIEATTGCRPHELLMRLSIRDVARALKETDDSVSEIAAQYGYRAVETLCRAFQRVVGVSPRAFRRRHRATGGDE